ncbi:Spc98 family-domain-containing protein [Boletus edulis BED1]|uniref:Spindle pole body component n=1 Tax=Boletus edulis BED1 TaxID=1328754 RepID=A0AAD4BKC6_BOLED|nr:Spc98 family-domain-containing protein [Boletus edulis BED1]
MTRPHSSLRIQRPSSSLSQRPPSSLSSARPASSASSLRPQSRISTRPSSRLSRPPTRQTTRLLPPCQSLVTQVTGLSPETDDENFRAAVDFVSKNLEYAIKAGASTDMTAMDKDFRGHVLKASINSHDDLADALQASYRKVKQQAKELTDLDERIKLSRLPDHLQLLILLSSAPGSTTHAFAQAYKDVRPLKPPVPVTWKEILDEEPFEGQHWEGVYGIPPGSTVEGWETRSGGSTPSLSPWDEDDSLNSDGTQSSFEDLPPPVIGSPEDSHSYHLIHHKQNHFELVERLKARQYWRDDWKIDVDVSRPFHIGDPSTLGPASLRVLGERATLALVGPEREKYIHERDAVREVLTCLQGRKNLMIYTTPDTFSSVPSPTAPRLLHFTSTAQSSILGAFAQVTTTVCHLRKFVSAIFDGVSGVHEITPSGTMRLLTHNIRSRTIEAFADAMDTQIQIFDRWCAEKEEAICRAQAGCGDPLLVSLLSLEKDVRDTFSGIFDVVLDILHRLVGYICQSHSRLDQAVWNMPNMPTQLPSAIVSALLLDLLLQATEEQWSMGNVSASSSLAAVFAKTSEPIWHMIGKWLKDGMPVRNTWDSLDDNRALDEEFFIEDNELPLLDPDLWADGYVLRSPAILEDGERKQPAVPAFLGPVVDHVLEAGKAVGLLRMMGIHFFSENATDEQHPLLEWKTFTRLFESNAGSLRDSESLSHLISEELSAYCLAAGLRLSRLLIEECELSRHLAASQGLYLMTRGDVMTNFTDVIFAKMDSQQAWNDFHFLNSAFRDVVESANSDWIDASLIRLAYRGTKASTISNTVKAIEGLLVEYAVPFPLTYIFTSSVLQSYCSLFVFLLQVRKAKCVLERILLRGAVTNIRLRSELKVFYAMRGKLSWFVNTLFNFLTTNVIHVQVLKFKSAFKEAKSLDEMIKLHNTHLEMLLCKCFLDSSTSSLSKAILGILDMCLHFRTFFTTFAGDTTHDISRLSISMRRHRSRRQRRQRKDVIGFSIPSLTDDDDSDSDSDTNAELDRAERREALESSLSVAPSFSEEDLPTTRLETLSGELDGLVRYVRRGAEGLARGTSDAAAAFGVLAFMLEDWDS